MDNFIEIEDDKDDNENDEFTVADAQEDTAWLIDLEAALLSDCDFGTLRSLCHSRAIPRHLRAAVWRICFNIEKREAVVFHDVFDLPEQSGIHEDCVSYADKLQLDSEGQKIAALSNMESVITEFCKRTGQKYSSSRKWLAILRHLLALDLSRQDLYHFFVAITERYVVWNVGLINAASTLFRLLMLYHDPELCSLFDTKKIEIASLLRPWLLSIFAEGVASSDVLLSFWDCYFLQADTFFVFFLAFVIVLNLKEQLTGEWKQLDRGQIGQNIQNALAQLSVEDIPDFFQLALHYASQTPASFRNDYSFLFFDSTTHQRDEQCTSELPTDASMTTISPSPSDLSKLDTALCLQISVPELMQSLQLSGALRFFIVDCRPAEQYNFGHLRGSVHLDASLLLDDPAAYNTAVAAVIDLQQSRLSRNGEEVDPVTGLGPSHICFVGSGRDEEDKLVNMVIANFLQRQMRRVAVLRGGYAAVHEGSWANLDEAIADHDENNCIVCLAKPASGNSAKKTPQPQSGGQAASNANKKDAAGKEWTQHTMSLMRGFGSSLKSRFGEVMSKGLAVAANTANTKVASDQKSGALSLPSRVAHVIGTGSKAYRKQQQQDVFAMNDNEDSGGEDVETVNIAGFLGRPDVKHSFTCKLLDKDENLSPSFVFRQHIFVHLVITSTHVFILRQLEDVPEMACVHSRKRLDAIMKITSRRQMPELITLRYGRLLPETVNPDDDKSAGDQEQRMEIEGGDRLFIPERAGEAASAVKYQIVQYLRSTNLASDL